MIGLPLPLTVVDFKKSPPPSGEGRFRAMIQEMDTHQSQRIRVCPATALHSLGERGGDGGASGCVAVVDMNLNERIWSSDLVAESKPRRST